MSNARHTPMSEASRTPETDAIVNAKIAELEAFKGHMNAAAALNFLKPFMQDMARKCRSLETQRDAALERERGLRGALERVVRRSCEHLDHRGGHFHKATEPCPIEAMIEAAPSCEGGEVKFSLEIFARVYCDETGEYIQVGPDSDGLGCVEIQQRDAAGKELARITAHPAQAGALVEAIKRVAAELPKAGS